MRVSHSVDLQSAAATLVASLWRKVCLRSPTGAETQNTGNSGYLPLRVVVDAQYIC